MCGLKGVSRLVVVFLILCHFVIDARRTLSDEEDLELKRQLNILNKQPVNSFKYKGDIFDCINIYKQPALDHPLLKNHKIQSKPVTDQTSTFKWAAPKYISCPQGTVPIRRTHMGDLIIAKTFSSRTFATSIYPRTIDRPGQHVVALRPSSKNSKYYGVNAHINIYNSLHLNASQFSTAQMWLENGPLHQYTSLQTGWMVSPRVAGNSDSRLFIYWTVDNSKTGCYNFLCPGFVQVDPKFGPGSFLIAPSKYGGKQYSIDLAISQDNATGNWWLVADGNRYLGYWPRSLVPQLEGGASLVAWGGLAGGPLNGDSPPMGNGYYPQGDFTKACFFRLLQIVDDSHRFVEPNEKGMESFVDNRKCYGLEYFGYKGSYYRLAFLFGGPGGKCGV